jgi:hypothetical protein
VAYEGRIKTLPAFLPRGLFCQKYSPAMHWRTLMAIILFLVFMSEFYSCVDHSTHISFPGHLLVVYRSTGS